MGEEVEAEEDDFDIFEFSSSNKRQLAATLKPTTGGKNIVPPIGGRHLPLSYHQHHTSDSSGDSDDDGRSRRGRRGGGGGGGGGRKRSMASSRLLRKKSKKDEQASTKDCDDEVEIISSTKKSRLSEVDTPSLSPSPPWHASSLPSPPPPGAGIINSTADKSRLVLNQANDILNRLWYATPSMDLSECHSDLPGLVSFSSPSSVEESVKLRVRCKGKVRKYTVNKWDPFSKVIAVLSEELEVTDDEKILLSHKTSTMKPTDSPGSLGLTTADIIDAVVMEETASSLPLNDSQSNSSICGHLTIKVQTSSKQMMYNLASTDPLQKAMSAFAAELNTPISKLRFSFDGETLRPSQTPQELDMENDDCIDVTLLGPT